MTHDAVKLFNPDRLTVDDPIEASAKGILYREELKASEMPARLFMLLWRESGGKPATLSASVRDLHVALGGSESNVRMALRKLEERKLVSLPEARMRGRFEIGVLLAAPRGSDQQMLWEPMQDVKERPRFEIVEPLPQSASVEDVRAMPLRNDIAQRTEDCATPLRNAVARDDREEKRESKAAEIMALAAKIGRPSGAADGHSARNFLERPLRPSSEIYQDVPRDVPARDVEKCAVEERSYAPRAERLALLASEIGAAIRDPSWRRESEFGFMPLYFAWLQVAGKVSESAIRGAIETTQRLVPGGGARAGKYFAGAIANQLRDAGHDARVPTRKTIRTELAKLGIDFRREWWKAKSGRDP